MPMDMLNIHHQESVDDKDIESWKCMVIAALTQGEFMLAKTAMIAEIGRITPTILKDFMLSIPQSAKCAEILDFLMGLLPVLLSRFSTLLQELLPKWIINRVTSFETGDPSSWPEKTLELVAMVHETLMNVEENVLYEDVQKRHQNDIAHLKNQLEVLSLLKSTYAIE